MEARRFLVACVVVGLFMCTSLIAIPGSDPVVQTQAKEDAEEWTSGFQRVLGPALAYAGASGKPQTLCPIMGGPIDRSAYLDHEGKRIYFCCVGCKDTFKKKAGKYIKGMESKGIELEKAPTP